MHGITLILAFPNNRVLHFVTPSRHYFYNIIIRKNICYSEDSSGKETAFISGQSGFPNNQRAAAV